MENPTFRLEGVVRARDETEDFEGPLTLILQLLSKNKIEIQDIRISSLLDQYMAYLERMKEMDLDIASEFVAMASYLVYIKARVLLSAGEEPSELEELKESLERLRCRDTYGRIRAVTEKFSEMYMRGGGMMVKPPEYLPASAEYRYTHEKKDILDAMLRVLSREEAIAAIEEKPLAIPRRIVYSVPEKTEEILELLASSGTMSVRKLIGRGKSRTEVVATFIALLELCSQGRVGISGDGDELSVSRQSGGERTYGGA